MRRPPALASPAWHYPSYVADALRDAGLEERDYQKIAVAGTLDLLRHHKSAEVDLPPGTGKTLVGHISAWIWTRELSKRSNRVLVLVPSTILLEQHSYAFSRWVPRGDCPSIEWSSEWLKSKNKWHAQRAEESSVFFALPEALAGSIESGQMPQTVWNRIGFVVVDEYDAFSLGTLQAEGAGLRNDRESVELKLNLSSLVTHLRKPARLYLRLSATPLAEPAIQGLTKNEASATKPRLHGPSPQGGRTR